MTKSNIECLICDNSVKPPIGMIGRVKIIGNKSIGRILIYTLR